MAAAQSPEAVRVRLFAHATPIALVVQAADGPVSVEGAWSLSRSETLRLGVRGRLVEASANGRTHRADVVRLTGERMTVRLGAEARTYRGSLAVRVSGGRLEVVNTVPLEDYVASVVASEYPFPEGAGIEAQAILARTYAARRAGAGATYDLDDHQMSQVYRGETAVTDRARRAARETAGEVLTYRGALAETPYFSSSGGHTADNEAVWRGAPLPYLRGVPDPTDADAPDHRWTTSARRSDVHRALSRGGQRATSVEVGERSRNGRVRTVRLGGGAEMSGSAFRRAVNASVGARTILSTHFEVRTDGDRYVFEGRGFGHGVGMSQYGARGLARQGQSAREILAHYFPGTAVARLDGATRTVPASPPVVRRTPPPAAPRPSPPAPRRRAW